MSCKCGLYAVNTSSQDISAGGTISFGSIVRRYGNSANLSGGNVDLNERGYYNIDANISFEAEAGTTTITMYQDGIAIPGANVTLTTLAATLYDTSIPCIVRNKCCCGTTITVIVSGAGATVNNASISVVKI